jgi:hypothetical protein
VLGHLDVAPFGPTDSKHYVYGCAVWEDGMLLRSVWIIFPRIYVMFSPLTEIFFPAVSQSGKNGEMGHLPKFNVSSKIIHHRASQIV